MPEMHTVWLDLLGHDISQRFYDVGDGVRMRALEAGDGPPMIWLHGGGGHAETYVRNISAYAPHRHSYAVDFVGQGFSDAPDTLEYTTNDAIEYVVRFMDALGLERVDLSGESFGGRVANWIAIRYPDRVNKLVLNTSGGLPATAEEHQSDVNDLFARTKASLEQTDYASVRRRMEWLFADPAKVPDELVYVRKAIYERPEIKIALTKLFSRLFDPSDAKDYWLTPDRLARIKAPTLVMWSDHNPIHTYEHARAGFGHIPDVRFHLVKDAAHWPHYEQPEEYNRVTLDFLLAG